MCKRFLAVLILATLVSTLLASFAGAQEESTSETTEPAQPQERQDARQRIAAAQDDASGDGSATQQQYDDEGAAAQQTAQDAECQNPQEVASVGPTNDNTVTPFKTTGRTFRVTYDVAFEDEAEPFNAVNIDIEDRFGLADFEIVENSGTGSFVSTEGAGSYELVVNVDPKNGAEYTITVEDCGDSSDGGGTDDGGTDGGGTSDEGETDLTDAADDVIKSTIPKGTLSNTGGFPLAALLGLGMIGGGLVLVRRALP